MSKSIPPNHQYTKTCEYCGKEFLAYEKRRRFCGRNCAASYTNGQKKRQKPVPSGVYAIRNTANDMTYIGSSNDIERRWRSHKSKLRIGNHENPNLQKDYDTFGPDNFMYEVLELAPKDGLHAAEQKYLDDVLERNISYNIHLKSDSAIGRTFTPEQNIQNSQRLKGRAFSEEHRRKISVALEGHLKGRTLSAEHRQKLSVALKGKPKPRRSPNQLS